MTGADSEEYGRWSKTRLDRILVDFMLREGFTRTAETLAKESSIKVCHGEYPIGIIRATCVLAKPRTWWISNYLYNHDELSTR